METMQAELVKDEKSGWWFPNHHGAWLQHKWQCNLCKSMCVNGMPKILKVNGEPTINCSECYTKETGQVPQWICCACDYDKVPIEHYCDCAGCNGIDAHKERK